MAICYSRTEKIASKFEHVRNRGDFLATNRHEIAASLHGRFGIATKIAAKIACVSGPLHKLSVSFLSTVTQTTSQNQCLIHRQVPLWADTEDWFAQKNFSNLCMPLSGPCSGKALWLREALINHPTTSWKIISNNNDCLMIWVTLTVQIT